jgi:uncharacterized protein (TIGR03435 family)
MIIPDLPIAVRFAANHLWQSTLTAGLAAGLVWTLRKSEARLRHVIWMLASLKFLVPFALLEQIGTRLMTQRISEAPSNPVVTTLLQVGQPFAPSSAVVHERAAASTPFPWVLCLVLLWAAGAAAVLFTWLVRMQRVRRMVRAAVPQHSGPEADTLRRIANTAHIRHPLPLLMSKDCMEPGVFGIFRPVLLWPEGISAHLDDAQISAIVAHEVWHVRRRDNLFALLHMFVEAAFWFHPLVWWMGARLLEERERSCDEAVLQTGNEPAQYADAILKACRFCVESPLICVSGVSGSDLKRRMVQIMNAATVPLSRSRKMLLASVAVATLAGPIVVGALHPRVVIAQEPQGQNTANLHFDSASLTPSKSGSKNVFFMRHGDEFIDQNITLKDLIAMAYGVRPERIVGGPDWINTQRFDFEARWTPKPGMTSEVLPPPPPGSDALAPVQQDSKVLAPPSPEISMRTSTIGNADTAHGAMIVMEPPAPAALQAMLRNFLAEHVNLKIHDESAVLPVYDLVVANGGSKLAPSNEQPESNVTQVRIDTRVEARATNGQQSFAIMNGNLRVLCDNLSMHLDREVVDKTGLNGRYNFEIAFPAQADPDQIASALRDQYGLDLQSTQRPMEVHAIDSVQMPQSN